MNSFNPFNNFNNFNQFMNGMNNMNPFMRNFNNMNMSIDRDKFKQILPNLNTNILQQLVQQAKNQGISEKDIQDGINFIQQLK